MREMGPQVLLGKQLLWSWSAPVVPRESWLPPPPHLPAPRQAVTPASASTRLSWGWVPIATEQSWGYSSPWVRQAGGYDLLDHRTLATRTLESDSRPQKQDSQTFAAKSPSPPEFPNPQGVSLPILWALLVVGNLRTLGGFWEKETVWGRVNCALRTSWHHTLRWSSFWLAENFWHPWALTSCNFVSQLDYKSPSFSWFMLLPVPVTKEHLVDTYNLIHVSLQSPAVELVTPPEMAITCPAIWHHQSVLLVQFPTTNEICSSINLPDKTKFFSGQDNTFPLFTLFPW